MKYAPLCSICTHSIYTTIIFHFCPSLTLFVFEIGLVEQKKEKGKTGKETTYICKCMKACLCMCVCKFKLQPRALLAQLLQV